MKRYRFGEMDSLNSMANVLMLLSRGGGGGGGPGGGAEDSDDLVQSSSSSSPERVFECKTCNRQFPSFQALGGHRASHKKLRLAAGDGDAHGQAQAKPRVHECSICGLEFAVGQALGGHMRRHRGTAAAAAKPGDQRGVLLDLNLPPLENDPKLGLGLEIVDMIPMVDCLH